MSERDRWLARIKAVEREFLAMAFAARRLQAQARVDAGILESMAIRLKDVDEASKHLDGTYLIRLFAEFEAGLRRYWAGVRPTSPRTRDLLDALAAHRTIPQRLLEQAHAVRGQRNALVHERKPVAGALPIQEARGILCRFGSRLPESLG